MYIVLLQPHANFNTQHTFIYIYIYIYYSYALTCALYRYHTTIAGFSQLNFRVDLMDSSSSATPVMKLETQTA